MIVLVSLRVLLICVPMIFPCMVHSISPLNGFCACYILYTYFCKKRGYVHAYVSAAP